MGETAPLAVFAGRFQSFVKLAGGLEIERVMVECPFEAVD